EKISKHALRNEIIATMIGNLIIDTQGSTFVADYKELGHKKFMDKIKAFLLINKITNFDDLRSKIYALDLRLEAKKQYEMLFGLEDALKSAIEIFSSKMLGADEQKYAKLFQSFVKKYANSAKKPAIEGLEGVQYVQILPIIMRLESAKNGFEDVASLFVCTNKSLDALELLNNIQSLRMQTEWEEKLRVVLTKEVLEALLVFMQRVLSEKAPKASMQEGVDEFLSSHSKSFDRFVKNYKSAKSPKNASFVSFSVVAGLLTKAVNAKN
ncbi:MAG: hypothetical protein CSA19_01415, partial [Deltaproteobacteria bacterium]